MNAMNNETRTLEAASPENFRDQILGVWYAGREACRQGAARRDPNFEVGAFGYRISCRADEEELGEGRGQIDWRNWDIEVSLPGGLPETYRVRL